MRVSQLLRMVTVLGLGTVAGTAAPAAPRCDLTTRAAPADGDCARRWMDANLRINDLLTVGSHNSYKQAIPPAELAAVAARVPAAGFALDYAHRTVTEELDAGARHFEFDPYYDPQGGRYANPRGPRAAGADLGDAWRAMIARPGFKVFHVVEVDVRSSCYTLVACLSEVRRWSDMHPDHIPISILINAKDEVEVPDGVHPLPFDAKAFDALDAEIRRVFPKSKLITPDQVQGRFPTLRDAALADNWPKLGKARGKILFSLEDDPAKVAIYRGARKSLEGRVMFVNAPDEASPAAAFITLNAAVTDAARIHAAVASGLIVRTRADEDTAEARTNAVTRRDTALAGGAQLVSTDYLWPDPRFPGGYRVRLPGGAVAVCNPVRMAGRCTGPIPE